MQTDTQTTTIDGIKFTMSMLDPFDSNDLFIDVMKLVAPAIASMADGFKSGSEDESVMDADVDLGVLGKVASSFFEKLDSELIKRMASTFGPFTEMEENGKSLLLEYNIQRAVFRGRIDLWYRWLLWGANVQWGKCFSALIKDASGHGNLVKKVVKKA